MSEFILCYLVSLTIVNYYFMKHTYKPRPYPKGFDVQTSFALPKLFLNIKYHMYVMYLFMKNFHLICLNNKQNNYLNCCLNSVNDNVHYNNN